MTTIDWRAVSKSDWWAAAGRALPWLAGLAGLAMLVKAVRHVYAHLLQPFAAGEFNGDRWIYVAAQNQLNWLTTGFMRRELYNTFVGLVGLTGADAMASNAIVFLAFYFLLAAVLIWAVARRKTSLHQITLGGIAIAIFFRLSFDVGRSDVAVILCAMLAAWSARSGRWAVTATAVSIALAVHETGMIFLAPMALAIAWEQQAWRTVRSQWRSWAAAGAIMVVGLGLYVISSKAPLDVVTLARQIHAKFPEPLWADLASYFNLAGFRTIQTTWCEIPINPKYWLQVGGGVIVLSLVAISLRPKRPLVTLAASIAPFLFISLVATDTGRWALLGVATILALALTQPEEEDHVSWISSAQCAAIAFVAFELMVWKLGPGGEAAPIPWVNSLDRIPALYSPSADEALDICDPGWRDLLGLPKG